MFWAESILHEDFMIRFDFFGYFICSRCLKGVFISKKTKLCKNHDSLNFIQNRLSMLEPKRAEDCKCYIFKIYFIFCLPWPSTVYTIL